MPKKHPISKTPAKGTAFMGGISPVSELVGHLKDVQAPLARLGHALSRYYKKTDQHRVRFIAIEALYQDFSDQLLNEIKGGDGRK